MTRTAAATDAVPRRGRSFLSWSCRLLAPLAVLSFLASPPVPAAAAERTAGQASAVAHDEVSALDEVVTLRQFWRQLAYRDLKEELSQLRARYEAARRRGDRSGAWMHLAWLANHTAAYDLQSAVPLLAQAEQAIPEARRAGDKLATFELVLMTESTSVLQFSKPPSAERLALLQQLAADIGGPLHEGLVWKLRGIIAAQSGQEGEALFNYQRALPLLTGEIERAELLIYMGLALFDNPTRSAANLAVAYLDEVVRTLPPERYPGLLTPALRLSQLLSRLDRHSEAIALAQRALDAAMKVNLTTPLARAYVARGYAYLGAGEPKLALADFNALTLDALNGAYKLNAMSGRALALAQLGDGAARDALLQGEAIARSLQGSNASGLAQFYEASARVWQTLGDSARALDDLGRASSIRSSLASAAQERLAQARIEAATKELLADSEASRRQALTAGAALLGVALAVISALFIGQLKRRRIITTLAQSLTEVNTKLKHTSAARIRQLAAACRDLRQPAHVLGLLAESAPAFLQQPEAHRRHMDAVRNCSQALTGMLDALMDMTRLQENSYVPHAERFDLRDLLDEVDRQFQVAALQRGLRWNVQPVHAGVISDRHLLRRILANLACHTLAHAASGQVQIQVRSGEQFVDIEIHCTDSEVPITPLLDEDAALPHATEWDDADALGMGLATARQACRLLGHELQVLQSATGTLIRAVLPRTFIPADSDAMQSSSLATRSVALVEDDLFSRQTLVSSLSEFGTEVHGFSSLEELTAPASRFASSVPGVLVTDLHFGDKGDAIEGIRRLRNLTQWRDVPVLLLTGDIREEVTLIAEELGIALAYKPISARRLREKLALLRYPQPPPLPQETSACAGTAS